MGRLEALTLHQQLPSACLEALSCVKPLISYDDRDDTRLSKGPKQIRQRQQLAASRMQKAGLTNTPYHDLSMAVSVEVWRLSRGQLSGKSMIFACALQCGFPGKCDIIKLCL